MHIANLWNLAASQLLVKPLSIKAERAVFDSPLFLEKTKSISDNFVRRHALEVIREGYTVVSSAVDTSLIDIGVRAFYKWKERNHKHFLPSFYRTGNHLDRIINAPHAIQELKPLFSSNKVLSIQDHLFQAETVYYTSLFFEIGSTQCLHRDVPLFWTQPACMFLGTWIAMEDVDLSNGPLIVIPKSHLLPLLDRDRIAKRLYKDLSEIPAYAADLWDIYQQEIVSACCEEDLPIKRVCVKKGDTIIWHPLLVHGGAPIENPNRTRMSLVIHTIPRGVPVYKSDVFFNVKRRVSSLAPWGHHSFMGRRFCNTGGISIGHSTETKFNFSKLR